MHVGTWKAIGLSKLGYVSVAASIAVYWSCAPSPRPEAPERSPAPVDTGDPSAPAPPQTTSAPAAGELAFRDAVEEPPPDWSGPVFELSHDYPQEAPPACTPKTCQWLSLPVDFEKGGKGQWKRGRWDEYIASVLSYVREGQDPELDNARGVRTVVDGQTRWFHVPWMAFDPTVGREFVHGTTNERTASLNDFTGDTGTHGVSTLAGALSKTCQQEWKHGFESWAVGVYSAWGGYALGQIFPASGVPSSTTLPGGRVVPSGLPFQEGTVVAKFLFTNAPPDCVPYLKGAPEWQVHRHVRSAEGTYGCARELQTVRLTQLDVAVVDFRSPTHWVYGTYAFDGNKSGTAWDKLVPLGVQWGSDSETFPAVPRAKSKPIAQSVLNPDVTIYEHWGCEKRLAGPVDNPQSSCVSCHSSAFAAPIGVPGVMGENVPPSFGFEGLCVEHSPQNAAYFGSYRFPQAYPDPEYKDALPLDTSLQVAVGMTQYGYFAQDGQPQACTLGQ